MSKRSKYLVALDDEIHDAEGAVLVAQSDIDQSTRRRDAAMAVLQRLIELRTRMEALTYQAPEPQAEAEAPLLAIAAPKREPEITSVEIALPEEETPVPPEDFPDVPTFLRAQSRTSVAEDAA